MLKTLIWNLFQNIALNGIVYKKMINLEYISNYGIKILLFFTMVQLYKPVFCREIVKFNGCNNVIDMEELEIYQGELSLAINSFDSSGARVSCDFTVKAGSGRQVMFYFTDLYLGAQNTTDRVDKSCIEPKDVTGPYEIVPTGMRAIICSRTQVAIGDRVYTTSGSGLSIRFYRNRGYSITVYFKLIFTAFRSGSCRTSERRCSNERCISHEVVCNGHNPCGDHSDCPTGLEHLSSWAMSGIVVLALLSGGIFIIMAAVCLQRATSKRYDFDDISVPANGSLCHEHHNVEMNELSKEANNTSRDKFEQLSLDDRKYMKSEGKDSRLLLKEYQHSLLEPPSENDREHLIQSKRSSPENYSDDFGQSTQNTDLSPYPGYESGSSLRNISVTDQFENDEILSVKGNGLLVPDEVARASSHSHLHSEKAFHMSGNSLLYSDSESGGEDDKFKVASLDRNQQLPSFRKSSNSHNGAIGEDTKVYGDFQPTPPPYTSTMKNMKVMVDKGPSNQINYV